MAKATGCLFLRRDVEAERRRRDRGTARRVLWSINSDGVRCLRHIDAALRTATSAGNIAAAGTGPGRHSFDVASTHRARACAAAAMLWIIIYSDGIRCLRHADAALHTANSAGNIAAAGSGLPSFDMAKSRKRANEQMHGATPDAVEHQLATGQVAKLLAAHRRGAAHGSLPKQHRRCGLRAPLLRRGVDT